MRKGYLVGLGAVLAFGAVTVTDASACSRRVSDCGSSYYGYGYAPVPPAPVYGYGYAPRRIYRWNGYGFGPTRGYYGAAYGRGYDGYTSYGYGGYRGCNRGYGQRGYGYAPAAAYYYDDDDDDDY